MGGDKTCERAAHVCTERSGVGEEEWKGEGAVTQREVQNVKEHQPTLGLRWLGFLIHREHLIFLLQMWTLNTIQH